MIPRALAALDARFRAELAAGEIRRSRHASRRIATGAELRPARGIRAADRSRTSAVALRGAAVSGRAAAASAAGFRRRVSRWSSASRSSWRGARARSTQRASVPGADAPALRAQVNALCANLLPEPVVRARTIGRAVTMLLDIEDPFRRVAEGQTTEAVPAEVAARLAAILRAAAAHARSGRRSRAAGSVRALGRCSSVRRWGARRGAGVGVVSSSSPHRLRGPGSAAPARRRSAERPTKAAQHRRRRDGFALTDLRMSPRESDEVDYCLYCHERQKDSCSTGCTRRRAAEDEPAGHRAEGCPLDEKISEMHVLQQGGRFVWPPRDDHARQPHAARHRPPHLQRLHEGLHLSEAGAGQHPADRDRGADRRAEAAVGLRDLLAPHALEPAEPAPPYALPTTAGTCWSSGLGPAGYTLSHHLFNEGFGVVGIDGLKIEPLRADLLGADVWPPRAIEDCRAGDAADAALLGGLRRRGRVRHHRTLGQELPDHDPPGPGAAAELPVYGGVRFGGTLDAATPSPWASTTSPSPPAPASPPSST